MLSLILLKQPPTPLELCILALFFVLLALFFIKYFRGDFIARTRIPKRILAEGFVFPLAGVSSIVSHNSLFPKIKLYPTYFEYRILFKKKVKYTDITSITIKQSLFSLRSIILTRKNNGLLALAPGKEENLKELYAFLSEKISKK